MPVIDEVYFFLHTITIMGSGSVRSSIASAIIYLCAATTFVGFLLTRSFYHPAIRLQPQLLAALFFALAAVALRYKPAVGHWLALVTGASVLVWLCREPEFGDPLANAWIALNIPDTDHEAYYILHAKLTILAVWFMTAVIGIATLRLLPLSWTVRRSPIRNRTWPALAISFIVFGVWFSKTAIPYRIAGVVDIADATTIKILHIEKRGLQFHETLVEVRRDGVFRISRNNRRLFEYRFQQTDTSGSVPQPLMQRAFELAASIQSRNMPAGPPKSIRAWNAEGWYFYGEGSRLRLQPFSSEFDTRPPAEIVEFFHQVQALTPNYSSTQQWKDVCLGFCYDPAAGLGALYANQRCFYRRHDYQCY